MKKSDYITTLNSYLKDFSESDRQEILSDIEEHFSNGIREGKTEDEISSALGDPQLIARQYRQEDNSNSSSSNNYAGSTISATRNANKYSPVNIVLLVILNIFLASWILPALLSIVFGFWMSALGILIAGIAVLIVSLVTSPVIGPTGIFAGIGMISLALLAGIGLYYLTKLLVKLIIMYVKWNVKFAKGDA